MKLGMEVLSGLRVASLSSPGVEELFLTVDSQSGDLISGLEQAARVLCEKGASILALDVFAPIVDDVEQMLLRCFGERPDFPVTWVDSGCGKGSPLSGANVHAVSGSDVERVSLGGRVVGSVFEDGHCRYCRLGDIHSDELSASPQKQTQRAFELTEAALEKAGMDFSNVLRTWLYAEEILSWYDELNRVRDSFFADRGVFGGTIPASTGIGGSNPSGSALVVSALAVKPKGEGEGVEIAEAPSPLQCGATEYGSSFSRAVELSAPDHRRLLVSGTASINPDGETVHLENVAGQIELTMEVIEAILTSRNMAWDETVRAVAYLKRAEYLPAYVGYCEANGLDFPAVISENDICRDDLLFEIEVDVVSPVRGASESD